MSTSAATNAVVSREFGSRTFASCQTTAAIASNAWPISSTLQPEFWIDSRSEGDSTPSEGTSKMACECPRKTDSGV
jgi:hypothetical protein